MFCRSRRLPRHSILVHEAVLIKNIWLRSTTLTVARIMVLKVHLSGQSARILMVEYAPTIHTSHTLFETCSDHRQRVRIRAMQASTSNCGSLSVLARWSCQSRIPHSVQ